VTFLLIDKLRASSLLPLISTPYQPQSFQLALLTERALNPASHGSTTPLYEEEVRRAKKLIERLEWALLNA
jgi:hypothetical protein